MKWLLMCLVLSIVLLLDQIIAEDQASKKINDGAPIQSLEDNMGGDVVDSPLKKPKKTHHHRRKTFYFGGTNATNITVNSDITLYNENTDNSYAKNRIIHDKQISLCRRTRATRQYYSSYGPCPRWSNSYEAYDCRKNCQTNCQNPCKPASSSIYVGPAKDWIGPKYGCNCHPRGSELQTCDIRTGKCRCKAFYVGRACDRCQTGFWENTNQGCIKCNCSSLGSDSSACNQSTGQCACKPGITGLKCDSCMPNFYGFSGTGCKPCDDCSKKPGHICDKKTGRCVCPAGSTGPQCKLCMQNKWNYKHLLGCEECQCSPHGSLKTQCNLENGQCQCKPEFDGQKCDRCRHGYHGYPACKRCKCDPDGTDLRKGNCNSERVCQCADDGTCPCKKNVEGTKCNTCKNNFFGLHNKNPHGCIECFCFGRSKTCKNAPFTWGQIRTKSSRALTRGDITTPNPVIEADKIVGTDGNLVINDIDMYNWMQRSIPLYWSLHEVFKGSKILSYNGYLRFQTESYVDSYSTHQYPLVKIIGNDLELHYYYQQRTIVKQHEIKLQEDEWKIVTKRGPTPVSKAAFMVVLQNIKDILIKATDPIVEEAFSNLTLSIVSLDTAQEISGNPPPRAIGVELCNCPKEYSGSSCQNPNLGYYRYRDDHSNIIDAKVGRAEACACNNRSKVCEIETGKCLNCSSNTAGFYCENCAEGFYNHKSVCQACPCPTPERNFAVSCNPIMKSLLFKCVCKEGYTGEKCDECAENYYGNPKLPNGECKPCNCNQHASVNSRCDHYGQCICKNGFTGKQCNQCEKSRHIVKGEDCIPCDQCTLILLDNMDDLSSWLHGNTSWLLSGSIEPPWGKLKEFEDRYNTAKLYFETYERNNTKAKELLNQKTIHHLENKTKKIKDNVHDIHSKLTNITRDANAMEEDSDKCYKELDDIQSDLDETTAILENFGKAHVSTKAAVKEAKQLLKDIKHNHDKVSKINHDEVFSKCKTLEDIVHEIHKDDILGKILKLKSDMRTITEFLKNTDENLNNIEPIVIETMQRNENNEQEIDRLLGILKDKEKDVEKLTKEMNEANEIVDRTTGILGKTEKTIGDIRSEELKDSIEQLDERQMQLDVEGAKLEEFIEVAKKHTQDLNLKVEHIEKILAQSDKEVNAVKASEAYSNIAKSLREANDTISKAQKLLDETLAEINSTSNDSLSTKSFIILTASTRLEHRINALQERVKSMTEQLALRENLLSKIRDKAWDNGIKNGEQSKLIQDIHGNYTDFINLKKTMDDAIQQSQAMKKAYQEALDLKHVNMQYDLNKTFEKCKNLTAKPQLNKLGMEVAEAKRKVNDLIHRRLTNFDAYNKQNRTNQAFDSDNKSLGEKLDKLKKLIQKSKEIAEEIRVSISGDECQRQYRLNNLRPSLVTELVLRFMVYADGPPSPTSLFHIDNEGTDYINVEVNKLKVKFTLKIGQNSETISMDGLKREGHNNATLKRTGDKLTLTVNEEEKSVHLKPGSSVLNVHGANMIHIGGFEKMTGLTNICLDDVIFNKMKIGLWDFVQTGGTPTKCNGCVRNAEKVPGHNIYSRFNGEGYSQIMDDKQQPKEFSITFSLRTFDENALLFLAISPQQPETYLIITLNDGHIQYEMQYNKTTTARARTKLKYNSGSKVEVDLRKQNQRGNDIIIMSINRAQETLDSNTLIAGKQLLKIKKADIYLGGVPPDYKIVCVDCPYNAHSYKSLLGDIGSFYLTGGHFQLHESAKKHGVEWQDTPFEFEFAWFEGKGFLQLYPLELKETFSISFLIRTEKPNGLIMDITNIGEIILENGSISMNLENGHTMAFNTAINDDAYHVVELSRKKSGVYTLKLNDDERTATNNMVMEHPGDLFIGGRIINDHIKFDGELRDLIIDDNLIKFNSDTVKEFDNVKIGRSKPQKNIVKQNPNDDMRFRDAQAENIKDMQSTEGCDKVNYNYALEPNAAKFGDVPESYVKYYLKESFWKDEYSIEVEFRTFYKNGMLLFAQGDGKHFYLLELKDNLILLHISGKNKKSLQILKAVDDGQWHKILIERKTKKKKKKIILTVDGVKSKPKRMPQSKLYGEVFIGDVAKTTQHKLRKQLIPKIHPFRGCIKPLKLNNSPQSFVNHHQIGQCFPNIERGSYFRGDAYAIYNDNYKVVDSLELNFEFRTTEQNGILLSISSPNNTPALSLELHNGAVVLSVDMGDRIISNVTNSLSEYALCNNRWHNLTALISSELTVNVDGVSKSWVLSDLGHKDQIEGVFYIGGKPDHAPEGTLKVRDNFKGCIRNVKIGEKYVDWIDMQELNNVSLNSCPVT